MLETWHFFIESSVQVTINRFYKDQNLISYCIIMTNMATSGLHTCRYGIQIIENNPFSKQPKSNLGHFICKLFRYFIYCIFEIFKTSLKPHNILKTLFQFPNLSHL